MNAIDGLKFAFYLIIVGGIFRYIELRFPESSFGKALGVVY